MSTIHPVTIPKWGIEMQEGTVTGWHVAVGESVRKGDELIDIESDKIVNTMEAPAGGVLHRILAEADSTLKVGQLLGVIAPADTSSDDIDAFIQAFVPADAGFGIDDDETPGSAMSGGKETAKPPVASPPAATESANPADSPMGEIKASPIARRLAKQLGVDLSTIRPTGRGGRISREDVEAAAAGSAPDEAGRSADVEPLSSRELTAARRLVASKQDIPHFYLQRDLDMRAALAAKEREGVPLTALLLKAVAAALEQRPRLNAHLDGEHRVPQAGVSINVAVDTPEGLVAPRLDAVASSTVGDLSSRLKALAQRARDRQLSPTDLAPGGITVSNLGMFGITEFTAIINPPQVAILAVGRLRPLDLGEGAVPAMTVTLSCDHRAIDGAEGARFLAALQDALDTM
ncbi:MAG: dihydrolipoamide acetyltransferase family protein [Xanthomonadales bacterium]|jgi:pyruvate dehydrogenase E2 component (dihydrolipoamide acetyltransferase)|nr:dihydrolipoamide acetyltransferase family protein [Xanthomonadales bacterium]